MFNGCYYYTLSQWLSVLTDRNLHKMTSYQVTALTNRLPCSSSFIFILLVEEVLNVLSFSFSRIFRNVAQLSFLCFSDLNFLTTDVQRVEDELLLETSGRRCFRFLEGSERKSPRLRSKEGYCVILQYLGGRQYLSRTVGSKKTPSSTNYNDINRSRKCNRKDLQSHDHFKFLILDDSLPYPENTEVIFEWALTSNCQQDRGVPQRIETGPSYSRMGSRVVSVRQGTSTTSEVVWSSHPIAHFESYVSCRKRFVVVVGPPCLNYTQKQKKEGEGKEEEGKGEEVNEEERNEDSCHPSNCIFDAQDLSMKVCSFFIHSG